MPGSFGHHFVIGLRPGVDLDPRDQRLLADVRPFGVVVFRRNFMSDAPYEVWHARFSRLIAAVRSAVGRDDVMIGIDHEGGTVMRPPEPVTPFAFARFWADKADAVGRAMGVELASLGVNVNFAPVADIDSNALNPVIGPRAFGSAPEAVAAACAAFCNGLESGRVLPCAKHFPGHGDSAVDSHHQLPSVWASIEQMTGRELIPFATLVDEQIPMVMTAHVLYPAADSKEPATSSSTWIEGVLRQRLGFGGVIVTDDLGMAAVCSRFAAQNSCAQILNAGTDLIMVCSYWTDTERVREMTADLERGLQSGVLDMERLESSRERIKALQSRLPTNTPHLLPLETFRAHRAIAPMRAHPGKAGQTVSLDEE